MWDRGHGRAKQAIEGSGPGGAFVFNVQLPAAICTDDAADSGPIIDGDLVKVLP
jgi:hypothetical protein